MSTYVLVVLVSQKSTPSLYKIPIGIMGEPTVSEILKIIMNQPTLKDFKNAAIKDHGFYLDNKPIAIELIYPITIGPNKYTFIEDSF